MADGTEAETCNKARFKVVAGEPELSARIPTLVIELPKVIVFKVILAVVFSKDPSTYNRNSPAEAVIF